ncbi:MAG TPA: T9SS type A sorting domain-containing protein [Pseudobacter sp.]|nr:T9SS type A sorting domain-containing protein [Pseudobacter sp.]
MRTIITIFLLFTFSGVCQAQVPRQQAISAGGGSVVKQNLVIDFTIGEMVTATAGAPVNCTQGMQQPLRAEDFPKASLTLKGYTHPDHIELSFTTAHETNSAFFHVERSADGIHFSDIETIRSKAPGGNSTASLTYQTSDLQPLSGNNHYRIRQQLANGSILYSETIQLSYAIQNWQVRIWPNPANSLLNLYLYSVNPGRTELQLFSITGALVERRSILLPAGYSRHQIPLAQLKTGIYVLYLKDMTTGASTTVKLIKR